MFWIFCAFQIVPVVFWLRAEWNAAKRAEEVLAGDDIGDNGKGEKEVDRDLSVYAKNKNDLGKWLDGYEARRAAAVVQQGRQIVDREKRRIASEHLLQQKTDSEKRSVQRDGLKTAQESW